MPPVSLPIARPIMKGTFDPCLLCNLARGSCVIEGSMAVLKLYCGKAQISRPSLVASP